MSKKVNAQQVFAIWTLVSGLWQWIRRRRRGSKGGE